MRKNVNFFVLFPNVRSSSVVGKVPTYQPGGPCSIPGGVTNFNFYPGTGCVFCVLSCVVSGGGPNTVLTTHSGRTALVYLSSVLIYSMLLTLQTSDAWVFGL